MKTPLTSPEVPPTKIRKVAILFSGGPAPAANAVIASAAMCFSRAGITVLGLRNGYSRLAQYTPDKPLKEGEAYVVLDHAKLEGVRTSQGIIIGTARENPGKKLKNAAQFDDPQCTAPLQKVYDALISLGVDALISIGGDDTLTTAAKFKLFQDRMPADKKRIRVVHLPKTIDNDYRGIDFTFGYFTAVELMATEISNLLADAASTGAYYFAQVMGRKAGWLAYGAAIAGEASLVVSLEDLPKEWWGEEEAIVPKTGEKMLDSAGKPVMRQVIKPQPIIERIVDTIIAREKEGKSHGVIVFAEGMGEYLPLGELRHWCSEEEFQSLEPDSFGHFPVSQLKFTGRIGRLVNAAYQARTGKKLKQLRSVQFGYEVRCHKPTAFDVILGSQLGVGAFRALVEKDLDGVMVSVSGQLSLVYPKFEDLIDFGKLRAHERLIGPEEDFHQLARYLEVRVV